MRLFLICTCAGLAACTAPTGATVSQVTVAPVTAAPADPLLQSIREFLSGPATAGASVSVGVQRAGFTPSTRFASSASITQDRPFWIGSLTKPITAAAILKLEEQGKLSTSDPITRFFPDVPAEKRGITLHHLLTHTSGLPHAYASDGVADRTAAVGAILALPLTRAPGIRAGYSNDGYSLLAAVVEQASGVPYERYLQTQIFEPAGMSSAGFWPGTAARIPVTRAPRGKAAGPSWGYRGATGVHASAEDLLRFTSALREGRLLSPEKAKLAMSGRFEREQDDSDIGYGWFIGERDGSPVISHSGAEDGVEHFGWIYVFPQTDVTVVIQVSGVPLEAAAGIRTGLLQRVTAANPPKS